jgi:hypothetical protein
MPTGWIFKFLSALFFLTIVMIGLNLGSVCGKSKKSGTDVQVFCPLIF